MTVKRTRRPGAPQSSASPGGTTPRGNDASPDSIQCRWLPGDRTCPQTDTIQSAETLQHTLEELHVAEEELRTQNDELVQAQDSLQHERGRYLEMFEHAPDGYLVTDRSGLILEANLAAATLLQRPCEYLHGKPVAIFVAEEDRHGFRSRLNQLLHDDTTQEWETTLQPHTGPPLPVAMHVSPALDHHDQVVGLRWLLRDVSARRLADSALWKERNFISAILDTTAALMVVLDTNSCIVRFNRACELTTGYTQDEVLGQPLWQRLLLPGEVDAVKAVFTDLVAGHSPNEHENFWLTRSGEHRLIRWSNTVLKNRSGKLEYIMATGVDITAQRAAEDLARKHQETLAHSMRVSTIGEMTSGLAHEINQPLSAIANYAQGCVRRLESGSFDPSDLQAAIEQIALQAERAATIIQHLRHFVSKSTPQRNLTDINALIVQTIKFDQAELDKNGATLKLDLNALPTVAVDDIQIQQVVLNLVRNALDAIGQSAAHGRIDIRSTLGAGQEIEISVRDNGHGLPEAALEKVFEPFFSTKGNGMGLGLAISRTIIDDHGGRLWVTRNTGPGATFHFTLPLKNPGDDT